MITLDCEQGGIEWQEARLGIPTASEFSRIVTPGGKASASAKRYMADLVAERVLGYSVVEWQGNRATERGHALEPDALEYYGFLTDSAPAKVGFVYRDDEKMVGCSPDFMVGERVTGELKCPMEPGIHLIRLAMDELPREYMLQVQGQIWVTGAERADFLDYYPELPPLLVSVEPDEKIFAAFDEHIPAFIDELLETEAKLRAMGLGEL